MDISWGMPQGSVVGPEMFVTYSTPIEDIINTHNSSTSYADNTQLYVIIKPSDRTNKLSKFEEYIHGIRAWLTENKLMLNDPKTEPLNVKSRYARNVPGNVSITIGNSSISPKVRDLGVVFDDTLMINSHVNDIHRRA